MNLFQWEELCMGTYFRFQIKSTRASSEIAKFLNEACKFLHDADETFSLYKPQSELSKIARGDISIANASLPVQNIYKDCEKWKTSTDGWFDAINPNGIFDPSGIVKTWAAQQACIYLEANGFNDFTLNAGGDIYISSELSVKQLFKVGLANLNNRASKEAGANMIVNLESTAYRAAATSGTIEKGEHIWSKKNSQIPTSVLQVTVIGQDFVETDVWATALFSGGLEALKIFTAKNASREIPNVAVLTLSDGALLATANFANLLSSQ